MDIDTLSLVYSSRLRDIFVSSYVLEVVMVVCCRVSHC